VLKQKVGVRVGRRGGSVMMRFWERGVCRGREEGGEDDDGVGVVVQNHASVSGCGGECLRVARVEQDLLDGVPPRDGCMQSLRQACWSIAEGMWIDIEVFE
jgi:hypothetical protein